MSAFPFVFLALVFFVYALFVVDQAVWNYLAARARRKSRSRCFSRVRTFRVGTDLLK